MAEMPQVTRNCGLILWFDSRRSRFSDRGDGSVGLLMAVKLIYFMGKLQGSLSNANSEHRKNLAVYHLVTVHLLPRSLPMPTASRLNKQVPAR